MNEKFESNLGISSEGSLKKPGLRFDETTWDSRVIPFCSREAMLIRFNHHIRNVTPFYLTIYGKPLLGVKQNDKLDIYVLGTF